MMKEFNVAVVGATGLVGRTMVRVLEERKFPVKNMHLLASSKSAGNKIKFHGEDAEVNDLSNTSFEDIDIALFSAGKEVSEKYAPKAVSQGCVVIDNGSYWRMDERVPLVVPEVNPAAAADHRGLIANPNCSTIQLAVALDPVYKKWGLKRVVCSTYQSISGAGQAGVDKLMKELKGESTGDKHPIAFNTMFHPLSDRNGFTVEEKKMYDEIKKIMEYPNMNIAITCVRIPALGGHGESVNIELDRDFDIEEVRELFARQEHIILIDDMEHEEYPTPQNVKDTDPVYVGRIHRDYSVPFGFYLWAAADNLRKGAATNAVQIAEFLVKTDNLAFKPIDW